MKKPFALPVLLLFVGLFVTFVHEFAYRRFIIDGDYEFYGLVSHSGSDMLIVTFAMTVFAFIYQSGRL